MLEGETQIRIESTGAQNLMFFFDLNGRKWAKLIHLGTWIQCPLLAHIAHQACLNFRSSISLL